MSRCRRTGSRNRLAIMQNRRTFLSRLAALAGLLPFVQAQERAARTLPFDRPKRTTPYILGERGPESIALPRRRFTPEDLHVAVGGDMFVESFQHSDDCKTWTPAAPGLPVKRYIKPVLRARSS